MKIILLIAPILIFGCSKNDPIDNNANTQFPEHIYPPVVYNKPVYMETDTIFAFIRKADGYSYDVRINGESFRPNNQDYIVYNFDKIDDIIVSITVTDDKGRTNIIEDDLMVIRNGALERIFWLPEENLKSVIPFHYSDKYRRGSSRSPRAVVDSISNLFGGPSDYGVSKALNADLFPGFYGSYEYIYNEDALSRIEVELSSAVNDYSIPSEDIHYKNAVELFGEPISDTQTGSYRLIDFSNEKLIVSFRYNPSYKSYLTVIKR